MKKTLFSTLLLISSLQFNAQTTIFEETFDSTPIFTLPAGWSAVSRMGTSKWTVASPVPSSVITGFSGNVASVRANSAGADQLLVTPSINLQTGSSLSLSFLIGSTISNKYYAVYVLPASVTSFSGTESSVIEGAINASTNAGVKIVDLSSYAGQNVKVYFRLFNSPANNDLLIIDNIKITQQSTLGTSDIKQNVIVGIYPNPTSDYVYLKSKSKITKAEVFDAAGRKMDAPFNDNRLDIKNLQPGTYMVRFTESNKIYSQKIIKK